MNAVLHSLAHSGRTLEPLLKAVVAMIIAILFITGLISFWVHPPVVPEYTPTNTPFLNPG